MLFRSGTSVRVATLDTGAAALGVGDSVRGTGEVRCTAWSDPRRCGGAMRGTVVLGRTISLPAFAMGMGDDTRGMSITGEGNSGATGLSARVKLVRIEYVARSSSLEPSARATWGISGLRGIVGCRTTFGTSVCVRRASGGRCSVGDGIDTVCARTSSPSFGLVIVNALNPTTLVVLVFGLGAKVGARLMFGSGLRARLTWLRLFLGFGTASWGT